MNNALTILTHNTISMCKICFAQMSAIAAMLKMVTINQARGYILATQTARDTAISQIKMALFKQYQASTLIQATVERNPQQYAQALDQDALFTLLVGAMSNVTADSIEAWMYHIGQHIDAHAQQAGTNLLEKFGIEDDTGNKISYKADDGTWQRSPAGMPTASASFGADNPSDEWAAMFVRWVLNSNGNIGFSDDAIGQDRLTKMTAWITILLAAHLATGSIGDTPQARVEAEDHFFNADGLDYGFDEIAGTGNPLGFGRSQVDFTKWEVRRGVLNTLDDAQQRGSAWWRAVNGQLARDMEEARLLHEINLETYGGTNPAVDHWLVYIHAPSARTWYMAHDFSIVKGYLDYESLALNELFAERVLMSDIMTRLMLAQEMVSAFHDRSLGTGVFAKLAEILAGDAVAPEGMGLDFFVAIPAMYPVDYPLILAGQNMVMLANYGEMMVLGRQSLIEYAGVTRATLGQETRTMLGEDVDAILNDLRHLAGDMAHAGELAQAALVRLEQDVERDLRGCGSFIRQILGLN